MPEPWFFEDVVCDAGRVDRAREGLANAAASITEALRIIEQDIPTIVEDWSGQARWVFDGDMPGILEGGHELVATLIAAVSAVAYHGELAHNEAMRRSALRAQWRRDQRGPVGVG